MPAYCLDDSPAPGVVPKSAHCRRPPPGPAPIRALPLSLIGVSLALLADTARAQANPLDIGVRSSVVATPVWSDKSPVASAGERGKTYGIASVDEIKSELRLVKPVDERALVALLLHELDANGFHEFVKGQKPDILLAVSYGRGGLRNPFIRDSGETPGGITPTPSPTLAGSQEFEATTVTITGAFSQQLVDEKSFGYEHKIQKAGFEKLYIRITAFQYPSGPNTKARMLWKTYMVVDDPDHRDLNAIAAKMLEAGAPYFGRPVEQEIDVFKPVPDGRVHVGAPEVVAHKTN